MGQFLFYSGLKEWSLCAGLGFMKISFLVFNFYVFLGCRLCVWFSNAVLKFLENLHFSQKLAPDGITSEYEVPIWLYTNYMLTLILEYWYWFGIISVTSWYWFCISGTDLVIHQLHDDWYVVLFGYRTITRWCWFRKNYWFGRKV